MKESYKVSGIFFYIAVIILFFSLFSKNTSPFFPKDNIVAVNVSSASPHTQNLPKIVGYYPEWAIYRQPSFKPEDIDFNLVTHINYAFIKTDASGEVALFDEWAAVGYRNDWQTEKPFWGNFRQLYDIKQTHPHLKTLLSVGGWTLSDPFSAMAANESARKKFIQGCINFCAMYGFDGIDLDWEFPGFAEHSGRPEDIHNFTLLLQEMYTAAKEHSPALLVTIAAPAAPSHMENIQIDLIHHYVDWVNLMSYDFHGPWGGSQDSITNHNAPLFAPEQGNPEFCVEAAVKHYLSKGFPPEKLVLGIPLYGRTFAQAYSTPTGLFSTYQGAGSSTPGGDPGMRFFSDIKRNLLEKDSGYAWHWDEHAAVPYLYNPSTKDFISYDDEESIVKKVEFIRSQNLGGAMVWELGQDTRPAWDAMKALHNAMK